MLCPLRDKETLTKKSATQFPQVRTVKPRTVCETLIMLLTRMRACIARDTMSTFQYNA